MIDPSFRDALLKQNGEKPVEVQLAILDELMSTHRRYVRRLTIWPIVGWAACSWSCQSAWVCPSR